MSTHTAARKKKSWGAALVTVLLLGSGAYVAKRRFLGDVPVSPDNLFKASPVRQSAPAALAMWPWPKSQKTVLHRGVTHWLARQSDNTTVELLDFDFGQNPNLRFEIFDQDEDDARPFDNKVEYWPRGVGHITRLLNTRLRASSGGEVVAAWNGLFFGYDRKSNNRYAFHVSPVVLGGKVHDWNANHRWSFGVKLVDNRPVFKTFHLPSRDTLARELDWGGGSAQCLIRDGKPLKLQPFPRPGSAPMKQPVASTPQEAGHIPFFDHMKSCRASLGWTRDNRHLFLLFVKEPDSEAASIQALQSGVALQGGWMVSDLQRFWLQKGVWGAVNSDAGDVAQLAYLRPDGKYDMVPPRLASSAMRLTFSPDFPNAPQGGSLMYFYVRDASAN